MYVYIYVLDYYGTVGDWCDGRRVFEGSVEGHRGSGFMASLIQHE